MKSRLLRFAAVAALILPCLTHVGHADIQDSIADQEGPFRKLGRGLANVVYGVTEVPMTMIRLNGDEGHIPGATEGFTVGMKRAVVRMAYGLYEVCSFPVANHGTYRSPFHHRETILPERGYAEYPPELGFFERRSYTRQTPGH